MTDRDAYLRRIYGIGESEYLELLEVQGGRCAVCGSVPTTGRNMAVDHDHVDLVIRGILCFPCNKFVVARHHNGAILEAAAAYLREPPAVALWGPRKAPKPKPKPRRKKA